jgi:hypothetical protein
MFRCNLELGREFVADREPKSAARFQDSMDFRDPASAPSDVLIGILTIVVRVVFIANIERRIRKHEIDRRRL